MQHDIVPIVKNVQSDRKIGVHIPAAPSFLFKDRWGMIGFLRRHLFSLSLYSIYFPPTAGVSGSVSSHSTVSCVFHGFHSASLSNDRDPSPISLIIQLNIPLKGRAIVCFPFPGC